jgi:hypothetical protein
MPLLWTFDSEGLLIVVIEKFHVIFFLKKTEEKILDFYLKFYNEKERH